MTEAEFTMHGRSLSLSTTFGGSPVTAVAPFCLLVANVNTLLAQFLFVFLSGAGESLKCLLRFRWSLTHSRQPWLLPANSSHSLLN